MRILFPIHGLGPGVGSEDYMVEVARRLVTRRHQVTFVIPRGGRAPSDIEADVIIRRPAPVPRAVLWRGQYVFAVTQEIAAAAAIKVTGRYDAIMTGVLPSLFGLSLMAPATPRCYLTLSPLARIELLSYGELTLNLRLGAFIYHHLQRWAWRRSDVVVSYVDDLTRLRSRYLGGPPRAVVEAFPGVDHDRFQPGERDSALLAEWNIPPTAPVVVSFCRLIRSKDVAFLLRAFARADVPVAAHLLIIGRGSEQEALERLARKLGLSERAHFAGFRANVEDYLRLGHVYVFPSRLESFGLTLAQAMASGLPAVARRVHFPEVFTVSESIIREGHNGYLVDTEEQMAAAIADLVSQPDTRAAMGRHAAESARAMFDWDRHADAIEAALQRVVRRGES